MNHGSGVPAYGLWSLVIINSAVFIIFAFSFFKPTTKRDWRTFSSFSAFIVALFVEMYGFPLTIYLLSGWLSSRFPGVNWYSHDAGHLLEMMMGWKANPHFGPFHLLSFVLIGGGNRNYRIIYMDGRDQQGQVQGDDDNPLYYGRAVAHWENDTFVVNTTGFNEDFWFSNGGLVHTDQLKLLEKISRPDFDTLKYEVTIDDPGAYTRPWSASWTLRWVAGEELPRHLCQENRP